MNLSQFCGTALIDLELKSKTSEEVLAELVELLANSERIKNPEAVLDALKEREKLASTGIGFGVALPHARVKGVDGLVIAFGRQQAGASLFHYRRSENRCQHPSNHARETQLFTKRTGKPGISVKSHFSAGNPRLYGPGMKLFR